VTCNKAGLAQKKLVWLRPFIRSSGVSWRRWVCMSSPKGYKRNIAPGGGCTAWLLGGLLMDLTLGQQLVTRRKTTPIMMIITRPTQLSPLRYNLHLLFRSIRLLKVLFCIHRNMINDVGSAVSGWVTLDLNKIYRRRKCAHKNMANLELQGKWEGKQNQNQNQNKRICS